VAKARTLLGLRDLVGDAFGPEPLQRFARLLGMQPQVLNGPGVLETLGIDAAGTILLEGFELDARAESQLTRLQGFRPDLDPELLGEGLLSESRATQAGLVMGRVRVPVRPGGALRSTLERALSESGVRHVANLQGGGRAMATHDVVIVIQEEGSSLDVGFGLVRAGSAEARSRLVVAALKAWAKPKARTLDPTEHAVLTVRPGAVGKSGLIMGMIQTFGAVRDLNPSQSRRMAAQGFREAAQNLRIDAPDGFPRYDHATLTLKGKTLELVAHLSRETAKLDDAAWKTDGTVVDFPAADLLLSVNGSLLYGWPMLPPGDGKNPYRGRDLDNVLDDAGISGPVVLGPDMPFFVARAVVEGAENIGQRTLPFMRRFERIGATGIAGDGDPLFFAILAANDEERAKCALAVAETKCKKTDEIPAGKISKRDRFHVERKKVAGRWLFLASENKDNLSKLPAKLSQGARSAYEARFDIDKLTRELGATQKTSFGRYRLSAERGTDGKSFRFVAQPAP
jgi:hypothetical protein